MPPTITTYLPALHARRAAERAERERTVAAVRARLGSAAAAVRARFGVTRIVLFGSFARGDADAASDVDLLVDGLATGDYFVAAAELAQRLGRDVDLVRSEDASPLLRRLTAVEGLVIDG